MGIGWPPKQRKLALGGGISVVGGSVPQSVRVTVVDGPASIRGNLFYACSAETVARMFVRKHWPTQAADQGVVSVWFDRARYMPPPREAVAVDRSSRTEPLTADELETIRACGLKTLSPGLLKKEMPWELLLRHRPSKQLVWELLGKAVFDALCTKMGWSIEVVTDKSHRSREWPGGLKLPTIHTELLYGEADLLVAARAAQFSIVGMASSILTIDFDQVLQALLAPSDETTASYLQFKSECVNVEKLRQQYASIDSSPYGSAVSPAFYLLCAFKSDYSKPLCGPCKTRVLAFLAAMKIPNTDVVTASAGVISTRAPNRTASDVLEERDCEETGRRQLVFYPQKLLSTIKKKPHDLTDRVTKILWTLAYFGQYGAYRTPVAGPLPITLPPDVWELDECIVVTDD